MRFAVVIAIMISAGSGLAGCATSGKTANRQAAVTTAKPVFETPATGSMLPARHRLGALPLDVYNAETLRQQGITSAAGAMMQIPQNTGR